MFLTLILFSCGRRMEPVKVGTLKEYKDAMYGFTIEYPVEWRQLGQSGKARFYQSQGVADKFLDPGRPGELGTEVIVLVSDLNGKTFEDMVEETRANIKMVGRIDAENPVTVGNKEALRINYTVPITTKMNMGGYKIVFQFDTLYYEIGFAGFGEMFEAHAAVFDTMLKSFTLPVPVIKIPGVWSASTNLEKYDTPFFTVNYPDNLEFTSPPKGKNELSMGMRADRLDCSIQFDVFGAQGLPVEKVFDQNKGRYKSKTTGEIIIDGQKAMFLNYSPVKDIESRAYFLVKNDKVIRITLNYFAPQKASYLTPFEQIITTMKLK